MANQVKIDLTVQDQSGSVNKRISDVKELNRELTKAQQLATGTKTGSQAISMSGQTQEYGRARGSMGATGASARDFANQAQGLGGLVRLYATWAANIYAVGAAFGALREAANVTNMIEGMNQLGTESGMALGSMAKAFAAASGGAISLQEAVSATVKATSSGLSARQFQQLGEVATKASRALGVNMSDAVSRLTRGITKLEPELLDELGIFTKVGQASEEYAKRIGKSASSLTDFEKRQAFANAVLKEGMDKFGAIEVAANPYDKLSASLKNLTQSALEVVNKVLGPLINALSTSPVALTAVVSGLGVMLLKQAIPALGQYRTALTENANEAEKIWQARSDAVKKIQKDQFLYLSQMTDAEADMQLAKYEQSIARLQKAKGMKVNKRAASILADESSEGREKDIKYLKDYAAATEKLGNSKAAARYREAALALESWVAAERNHLAVNKAIEAQTEDIIAKASKFSQIGYARDQLESARRAKARSRLISQAAEDTTRFSMSESWANLSKGIDDERLTGASKGFAKLGGGIAIATTAATRFLSVLSSMLGYVGMAVGVLTTLYGWVRSNGEQAEKLATSIDTASDAVKAAESSFTKFNNVLSAQALIATSNAMVSVADSVDQVVSAFLEFDKASNAVDKLWEALKGMIGMSQQDAVATSLSKSISTMLKNIDDPQLKAEAETKIRSLLNVKDLSIGNLDNALEDIDPKKLKEIPGIFEQIKTRAQATVSAVTGVMDGFKEVNTAFQGLQNSLKQTDPLSTYADALAKQAKKMEDAFKDPTVAAATFVEILKDTSKLNAFPPEVASQILSTSQRYNELATAAQGYRQELQKIEEALAKTGVDKATQEKVAKAYPMSDIAKLFQQKASIEIELKATNASIANIGSALQKTTAASMEQAFKIALSKSNSAAAQAGIDVQKTILGFLPKSEGTIKLQMELENRSIDIRIQEIRAVYELTTALKLKIAEDKLAELNRKKEALPSGSNENIYDRDIAEVQQEIATYRSKNIAADIRSGKLAKNDVSYSQLNLQMGFSQQLNTLVGQKESNRIKASIESYALTLDKQNQKNAEVLKDQKAAYDLQLSSTEYLSKSIQERAALEEKYFADTEAARRKAATQDQQKTVDLTQQIISQFPGSDAAKQAKIDLPQYQERLRVANELFNTEEKISKAARDKVVAEREVSATIAKQTQELDAQGKLKDLQNTYALQALETSKAELEQSIANGSGLSNIKAEQLRQLDLQIIAQQRLAALDAESIQSKSRLVELEIKLKNAGRTQMTPEEISLINAQIEAEKRQSEQRILNINQQYAAQEKLRAQRLDDGTRIKAFEDAFTKSFEGLTDVIIEFTKTGKLNFKGMVDSFVQDLLRYELKQMQMAVVDKFGGITGITKSFMGALGFDGGGIGTTAGTMTAPASAGNLFANYTQAKGGAWDAGLQMFAKGGMFTNSIVDSPTMFKFAKGTGLMGEAGPEAIMPLKRGPDGTLGVRVQEPPIEPRQEDPQPVTIVNNFTINGNVDRATQQQIAAAANRAMQRATMRNS